MYKQRFHAFRIFIAIFVSFCTLIPVSASAQQEAVAVSSSAASAILYEPRSGRVLFEQNAHVKRPMASTTKLMTALLAEETLPSEQPITANAQALNVIGSNMGLRVGDTLSRDDLLKGLLLSSGNDAANVLALSMADSLESFSEMMNARALKIGMENTRFVTPSGLDADGHGSSAYDMALLAAEVLDNECLASICRMKTAQITVSGRQVSLNNHNKLLSKYPDAIGMKTGFTSLAGRCLVSAAQRNGVTLIAVTLDCGNDWEEHMAMFDAGFELMTTVTMSPPNLSNIPVYGGEISELMLTSSPVTITVPSFDTKEISVIVKLPAYVWAPVEPTQAVGIVEYRLHGDLLASSPVTAAIGAPELPESSWFKKMLCLFERLFFEAVT